MCSISRKAALATLLVLAPFAASAQPAPLSARVEAVREEKSASLTLSWPGRVRPDQRQSGRELVLSFSRPLGAAPLEGVPERLQGWVENVLYGYDSVLLVLAPGVAATVIPRPDGVHVTFSPEAGAPRRNAEAEAAERAAQRRIDYFKAVTLMDAGEVREARAMLVDLLLADPRDAQSTALMAQAEERLGRWHEAVRLYDRGLELTPNEPSLVVGKARLLHEKGDRAQLDFDMFRVKRADVQRVTRLSGTHNLPNDLMFSYVLENRRVDVDRVQRKDGGGPPVPVTTDPLATDTPDLVAPTTTPPAPDGGVAPFHGTRQKLELAVSRDWPEMQQSRLSLFAAQRTLGVGYAHSWRDERSETRAGLAWSEPTYAFLEGVAGGGRRDRLFFQHETRPADRWVVTLGAAYNRYGLAGATDLARSVTVEGAIRYILNQDGPLASVAYLLDAEYVGHREDRLNNQGVLFNPLPAASREVHIAQFSIEDYLADYVRYSMQFGYAYDRRGQSGPQGAFSLGWEPVDDLEIGLRASHARSTTRGTASTVDSAGGYLLWRY